MYFRCYGLPKTLLIKKSKKCCFPLPLDKEHGKRAQTLFKSAQRHVHHIYGSLERRLSWKNSLLGICKILRLFATIFTADDKYSLRNRDNLKQPIQMQLCQQQKSFAQFVSAVSKSGLIFQTFRKNDDIQSECISESTDSQTRGYKNI